MSHNPNKLGIAGYAGIAGIVGYVVASSFFGARAQSESPDLCVPAQVPIDGGGYSSGVANSNKTYGIGLSIGQITQIGKDADKIATRPDPGDQFLFTITRKDDVISVEIGTCGLNHPELPVPEAAV